MSDLAAARAIATALPVIAKINDDLKQMRNFIKCQSELGALPYSLAELPIKLQAMSLMLTPVHRQMATIHKLAAPSPRAGSPASRGCQVLPSQHVQRAGSPAQHRPSTDPFGRNGRTVATQTWSKEQVPLNSPHRRAASPLPSPSPGSAKRVGAEFVGRERPRTDSPRSPSPSPRSPSPKKPMRMLSRWPENKVEPREPVTPREQAIKADEGHPLHFMYVRAPLHWKPEPSGGELTCLAARQSLASLHVADMASPATRSNRTLKHIVFLEWANQTVGRGEFRQRKAEEATSHLSFRRQQFFTEGRGGYHMHLDRRQEGPTSLRPSKEPAELYPEWWRQEQQQRAAMSPSSGRAVGGQA